MAILKDEIRGSFTGGRTLPKISTQLDSVRSYQFECRFSLPRGNGTVVSTQLTTAAKQVSPIGGATDDIVVDRLNDKVFYPGKFTPEPLTITFDNQLLTRSSPALWEWFTTTYNPMTGDGAQNKSRTGSFKALKLDIMELNTDSEPVSYIGLYGVFPTGIKFSEKNYATNEFATIEVTFRYDFLDYQQSGVVATRALRTLGFI